MKDSVNCNREKVVLIVAESQFGQRSSDAGISPNLDAADPDTRAKEMFYADKTIEELEKIGLIKF